MAKLRKIAIIGLPGSGKTTLADMLALYGFVFHQDLSIIDFIYKIAGTDINPYKIYLENYMDKGPDDFAGYWKQALVNSKDMATDLIKNIQAPNPYALADFQKIGLESKPVNKNPMLVATATSDSNIFIAEGAAFDPEFLRDCHSVHYIDSDVVAAGRAIWDREGYTDKDLFDARRATTLTAFRELQKECLRGVDHITHFNDHSQGFQSLHGIAKDIAMSCLQ